MEVRMLFERLEERRLMSHTVISNGSGGYTLNFTDAADNVNVRVIGTTFQVVEGGVTSTYPAPGQPAVGALQIFTLGGNDTIYVSQTNHPIMFIPVSVSTGAGSDTIYTTNVWQCFVTSDDSLATSATDNISITGAKDFWAQGLGETDYIVATYCLWEAGNGWNHDLWGGPGNDALDATQADCPMNLVGDDGVDMMWGSEYGDKFDGGKGSDTMYGYGGNDEFIAWRDGSNDTVYGGEGTDKAWRDLESGFPGPDICTDSINSIEEDIFM